MCAQMASRKIIADPAVSVWLVMAELVLWNAPVQSSPLQLRVRCHGPPAVYTSHSGDFLPLVYNILKNSKFTIVETFAPVFGTVYCDFRNGAGNGERNQTSQPVKNANGR